jgi:hypothetical protein
MVRWSEENQISTLDALKMVPTSPIISACQMTKLLWESVLDGGSGFNIKSAVWGVFILTTPSQYVRVYDAHIAQSVRLAMGGERTEHRLRPTYPQV